jgi:hypothetical protein
VRRGEEGRPRRGGDGPIPIPPRRTTAPRPTARFPR